MAALLIFLRIMPKFSRFLGVAWFLGLLSNFAHLDWQQASREAVGVVWAASSSSDWLLAFPACAHELHATSLPGHGFLKK